MPQALSEVSVSQIQRAYAVDYKPNFDMIVFPSDEARANYLERVLPRGRQVALNLRRHLGDRAKVDVLRDDIQEAAGPEYGLPELAFCEALIVVEGTAMRGYYFVSSEL
jgi:hypothetical protein